MSDETNMAEDGAQDAGGPGPVVRVPTPSVEADLATIFGIVISFGLIVGAILLGQSDANFFNVPSLLIVLCGTMAATSVSYTPSELANAGRVVMRSISRPVRSPSKLAESLMDLAVLARKKGVLSLTSVEAETSKEPFLGQAMRLVVDGYPPENIERVLIHDMEAQAERHMRSASIMRRGSEIAPAMGLIGTLVGLVQMLADLENPETIGPAMAVALLTTFYGAILGTVVLAPLAAKLEKNSTDEILIKTLITKTALSITSQENPRNLEMLLNSDLPPSERIRYFD